MDLGFKENISLYPFHIYNIAVSQTQIKIFSHQRTNNILLMNIFVKFQVSSSIMMRFKGTFQKIYEMFLKTVITTWLKVIIRYSITRPRFKFETWGYSLRQATRAVSITEQVVLSNHYGQLGWQTPSEPRVCRQLTYL